MADYIEVTSNPIAPDTFSNSEDARNQKLSNSDFRKLLMTPRQAAPTPSTENASRNAGVRDTRDSMHPPGDASDRTKRRESTSSSKETKPKRTHHHPHVHHSKREHTKENAVEQTPRYRDRARERRDGKLVTPAEDGGDEKEVENDDESLSRTADYRAVAPSTAAGESLAERRQMIIQESKYLGGDMEHTHLVKGLDFVLLQKVRLEIQNKETEADQFLDAELAKPDITQEQQQQQQQQQQPHPMGEEGVQFRTRIAASICDFLFNEHPAERNEYFQPGRMAYRIELEDDSVDFEVPATVIRSKSDCLQSDGRGAATITTNEIVINKLTQILSYLRAGKRHAKKAKLKGRYAAEMRDEGNMATAVSHRNNPTGDGEIFEGVGSSYVPSNSSSTHRARGDHGHTDHHHHHHASSSSSMNEKSSRRNEDSSTSGTSRGKYFERPADVGDSATSAASAGGTVNATKEFMRELTQRFGPNDDEKGQEKASLERFFAKTKVTCYDECYPGLAESYDAMGDSDDEADFSKMDLGNKKGPVGRWDFETQEEYSDYMSSKEALPKAAFQYGVKMADGRRTRRLGPKDEKAELDRQLQKIQSIIHKRKHLAEEVGPMAKNPHY